MSVYYLQDLRRVRKSQKHEIFLPLANPFVQLFYSQQEQTVGTYPENRCLPVKDLVLIWVTLNHKSHRCSLGY